MKTLPRGICYIGQSGGRYKVCLHRQKHDYFGGKFKTVAEALTALDELKRILKDTPPMQPGRRPR